MRPRSSLPADYFEGMFAGDADPWRFESSPYEQAKYDRTLAALGRRRYHRALEVGCANGVLTQRLSAHCAELVALDVSPTALARAEDRCRALPSVSFARMAFAKEAPEGPAFDLVVLSEVAYYWDDADLAAAGRWLREGLAPGGDLLLVHWTGETDYPQTADAAVEGVRRAFAEDEFDVRRGERTPDYRLDLWRRR